MGGIVLVPLSRNKGVTIVDLSMAHLISGGKWFVMGKGGYAACSYMGRQSMHRFLWESAYGPIPSGKVIDHINGDNLDNRLENLRCVSTRINNLNRDRHRNGSLAGVWHVKKLRKKPYLSLIRIKGTVVRLGYFATAEEASAAYWQAVEELDEE